MGIRAGIEVASVILGMGLGLGGGSGGSGGSRGGGGGVGDPNLVVALEHLPPIGRQAEGSPRSCMCTPRRLLKQPLCDGRIVWMQLFRKTGFAEEVAVVLFARLRERERERWFKITDMFDPISK